MAPSPPRLRILSVGGNAVSAFLSWRLQATNACDVTLVWKSGFETVSQYGISFKSKLFGNERFKPLHVVRAPEDAAGRKAAFDYVLLCVKALPDVYDLAAVIESVVTPQHTCILVNTTHTLGVESHLEERFPTNVVLSLVSGAEINQIGASEFEHVGATDIWVGPANTNPSIPHSIQNDMAEALSMTLSTGQVNCKVSPNIRQQQYERMIGPIAFHPISVLFETPSHSELMEKIGVQEMISEVFDELLDIAQAQGCSFDPSFKENTIASMLLPTEQVSTMYQDFTAKRPMEIETYLGSPVKLAKTVDIKVPRIQTLYAILHNLNIINQSRPAIAPVVAAAPAPISPSGSVAPQPPPQRISSAGPRLPMNGMPGRGRAPSMGPPPPGRRGPPPANGYPPRGPPGGYPRGPPPGQLARRPSFETNDLEEFSHVVLYDDIPEGDVAPGYGDMNASGSDIALRERELALRQREMRLREHEMSMRRGGGARRAPSHRGGFDEDDDDDEYFDPMNSTMPVPQIDPDNFDMMSVTSRRNRKAPSASQLRKNPEMGGEQGGRGGFRPNSGFGGFRPHMGARNRTSSARMMADMPGLHDTLLENPMVGYSSDRYGAVDRKTMSAESRAGSLTRERLAELQSSGGQPGMSGAYPQPPRRTSISPGDPFNPGRRVSGRPSPPGEGGYLSPNMPGMNGRPSPPGMMRQPIPRHPPGQGNTVAPQQVEQHAGVSKPSPYPRASKNVRSLTGSASASAGSGESAHIDSENSAHSSQSSFAPRPPIGVR